MILLPQKVAYRGTLTGLRISAVDGTAFIDACAALVPYADGNHLVEIYDASGRMLRGYLAAVGDGEDLGADIFTGWDFTSGWVSSSGAGAIVDANTVKVIGTVSVDIYKLGILPALGLCKMSVVAVPEQGTYAITDSGALYLYNTGNCTDKYFTPRATSWRLANTGSATDKVFDVTSQVVQQVLSPSATGATIVSAKGGATANFAYKNASFTFNQASYQVIVRAAR